MSLVGRDFSPAIMIRMHEPETDQGWRTIPVSTWSDALDRLRLPGVLPGLTWRSGESPLAGRAVTVLEEVHGLGEQPASAFDVGTFIDAAGAGDVLVIELGGAEVSSFGGLAARATAARGVAGVLVNGGCRDLDEIRATGIAVCSRHVTPISGRERVRVAGVNTPIVFAGVPVAPGDYMIADATGVVAIAAARFAEVRAIAEDLDARDRRFAEALDEGQPFRLVAATLGHL
jgi:3-hexulose-6-phosphate synthase / 6-phospho-3-hexuloisomerase